MEERFAASGGDAARGHVFSWEPCGAVLVGSWEGFSCMQCAAQWERGVGLHVALDKPLTWDDERSEWRWHKTWRMPEVIVRVSGIANVPGASFEVRLAVVCAGNHANELIDVGVVGPDGVALNAGLPVVDGECRFSRLRLLGTSNTHGGKRFHLVVSVVARFPNPAGAGPSETRVLASLISSGFSVYSRKDADKKRKKVSGSGDGAENGGSHDDNSTYAAFGPELFTKEFVKKVSDHNGTTVKEFIDNSWLGLTRYFQAPNIRFKSRHPILLAARFSNVVVIMRDSKLMPHEDERALRMLLCACGFPSNCYLQACNSCALKINSRTTGDPGGLGEGLVPWMITLRDAKEMPDDVYRWLALHMTCVKSKCIGFIADGSVLPSQYVPLRNTDVLVDLYCRLYALEFANKAAMPGSGVPQTSFAEHGSGAGARAPEMGYRDVDMAGDDSDNEPAGGGELGTGSASVKEQYRGTVIEPVDAFSKNPVKAGFAEYFIGLHADLRVLLNAFLEAASSVVADPYGEVVNQLKNIYFEFTEALAMHSFMEDTIMFPELTQRVPGVTEAYNYDHFKQSDHLTKIHETLIAVEESNAAELFLQISGFAAIHQEHMEKEEEHLLPYFLSVFSDEELMDLIRRSSAAVVSNSAGASVEPAQDSACAQDIVDVNRQQQQSMVMLMDQLDGSQRSVGADTISSADLS